MLRPMLLTLAAAAVAVGGEPAKKSTGASAPSTAVTADRGKPETLVPLELAEIRRWSPEIKKLLTRALEEAGKAGGSTENDKFVYSMQAHAGFADVPMLADIMYRKAWKKGIFKAFNGFQSEGHQYELDEIKPGDIVFWSIGAGPFQKPHVMIYAGTRASDGKRLVVGTSNHLTLNGKKIAGPSIFDLTERAGEARLIGYARPSEYVPTAASGNSAPGFPVTPSPPPEENYFDQVSGPLGQLSNPGRDNMKQCAAQLAPLVATNKMAGTIHQMLTGMLEAEDQFNAAKEFARENLASASKKSKSAEGFRKPRELDPTADRSDVADRLDAEAADFRKAAENEMKVAARGVKDCINNTDVTLQYRSAEYPEFAMKMLIGTRQALINRTLATLEREVTFDDIMKVIMAANEIAELIEHAKQLTQKPAEEGQAP